MLILVDQLIRVEVLTGRRDEDRWRFKKHTNIIMLQNYNLLIGN
jgi:hypothetical protein